MTIRSLLIANRGEVAVRIIRACRMLDIRTVAIHSEADTGAYWTRLADQAVAIGPAPARKSYLSIERLIEAAVSNGVDAVHPGYGLLSESPEFAAAVEAAGLIFVGPTPDVIAQMGDKVEARKAAIAAGLPVLPGTDSAVDAETALERSDEIGFPLAVKASFGGGGRGLRVVRDKADLQASLAQASREAAAAFGRGDVFLERYVDRPRHVEVQILADRHGKAIHLGDRDCSTQRRHQKLIEEAPAPALSPALSESMKAAAVRLAQSVGYVGAGTVEFLVDRSSDQFFFLEMNTRLQVEHGVTELVTGVDIVVEQLKVADGQPLRHSQPDIEIRGAAIQARIAAEDPWLDFAPTPARITGMKLPDGPWIRTDFGVEAGDAVSPFYDSMFGKVQAWGSDREAARLRLAEALGALTVEGPTHTGPYLRSLLAKDAFIDVSHDTGSVERDWRPGPDDRPEPTVQAEVSNELPSRTVHVPSGGALIPLTVHGRPRSTAAAGSGSVRRSSSRRGDGEAGGRSGSDLRAPMDSVVAAVPALVGQPVSRGDAIVVVEAMKMEVVLSAPTDGILESLAVRPGDAIKSGAVLATFRPAETQGDEP